MSTTKKSLVKKILIAAGILAVIGVAVVIYLFTMSFKDTADAKADFTVPAATLINEFSGNVATANAKYTEKIVSVTGRVGEMESADTTINIKMIDTTNGSYAIFAFQANAMAKAKELKEGDSVAIKGSCSGGSYSDILEAYHVDFKRCVVEQVIK